ncbi:MAG: polyketide synthase dehydratase domain-containing protein, partial [Pseudomonadota bacterium]|nr:polyketide synthase dehydratase domain-containing protein [Pseudomonadota bacterium]
AVKSNIGHLESASGVAGVIKTVLALQHQMIPPNLHFHELNPKINLEVIPATVISKLTPWSPLHDQKRIAGISAFGFTGTLAHMILEEAPLKEFNIKLDIPTQLVMLSAKSDRALEVLLNQQRDFLDTSNVDFSNWIYTTNMGRDQLNYRVIFIVSSAKDFIEQVDKKAYTIEQINYDAVKKIDFYYEKEFQKNLKGDQITYHLGSNMDWHSLWSDVANEFLNGAYIQWNSFYEPYTLQKITLPTYPFQRQRYWVNTEALISEPDWRDISLNPILGRQLILELGTDIIFETHVTTHWPDFLPHHKIYDYVVIPGAAYLSAALSALHRINKGKGKVEKIEFLQPVVLPINARRCLHLIFKAIDNTHYEFKVSSADETQSLTSESIWTVHAQGTLNLEQDYNIIAPLNLAELK